MAVLQLLSGLLPTPPTLMLCRETAQSGEVNVAEATSVVASTETEPTVSVDTVAVNPIATDKNAQHKARSVENAANTGILQMSVDNNSDQQ